MSTNTLKFTLDNIIYNCTTNGKDDIQMILPRRYPSSKVYTSRLTKERSVILEPSNPVTISVILTNKSKSLVPKINISSEDKKAKIKLNKQINTYPDSSCMFTFTTTDGGASWLVNFIDYSGKSFQSDGIQSINNKSGSNVILDASDIHLSGETGPTIIEQFQAVETKIIESKTEIKNEVTNEIITELPNMIKIQIQDTEIIAEKI